MNYVVKNIETLRKRKGMTKTHIANHCGKTITWYADIAKGRRRICLDDVLLIAEAMEVEEKIFFDRKLSETLNPQKSA